MSQPVVRSEVPSFLFEGESLFGEAREVKSPTPRQVLPSAPVLDKAIDALFIEENVFDDYACAHGDQYCMMATVDAQVEGGQLKTEELKKFGLEYPGPTVSVADLGKDRILVRTMNSEADWKSLPQFPKAPSILVRLSPDSSKNSKDHLMARLAYGLYKFMWRNTLQSTPTTDLERIGLARDKRGFREAIELTLSQLGVSVVPEYDSEPALTATDKFICAYIKFERDPETTDLQEVYEWALENLASSEVQSAIAFVKRLNIF